MSHIVLLGDSIFDNGVYVPGEPDVVRQVRAMLPEGASATLLARDGAVTLGVLEQLSRLPRDSSHVVVSAGGNDALGASWLLGQTIGTVADALAVLEEAQRKFAADYGRMAEAVCALGLPSAFCTIYDTPPSGPNARIIRTALAIFNDMISRIAFTSGADLIDLRLICGEDRDYANPIEPSARGGEKIARAILSFVDGRTNGSRVIASPFPTLETGEAKRV